MALNADVCNPRFDSAESKVVFLVCLANLLPVLEHPSELYRGEVCGEWKAGPVRMQIGLAIKIADKTPYLTAP